MSERPSPIAGTWYPADERALSQDIGAYLDNADSEPPPGTAVGIVVPHAGYLYSGHTAAFAFRSVRELRPETVAVLSPLHRAHPATMLTSGHDAYRTPLGRVEIESELVERLDRLLRQEIGAGLAPIENDQEHSLEIELPFMQLLWGSFRLIPIMIREQSPAAIHALGLALAETLSARSSLIVASSDLSHFQRQARALQLDGELLRLLQAFDPEGILEAELKGTASACGRGAIAAALWATRALGADSVTVLHHATSAEVTGDKSSVVGYGAAVIWRKTPHR